MFDRSFELLLSTNYLYIEHYDMLFNTLRAENKMEKPQVFINPSYIAIAKEESTEEPFEAALVQAVNDIFSVLGESVKQSIYGHLRTVYGINKDEIPNKIEVFASAVEETFGSVGRLIEIKIIERLHSKYVDFCYFPPNGDLDFVGYVSSLRDNLEIKA